ncbi:MAG: hypothetical protein EA378_09595 [Phycisphaerales bacterium]|nr:MAG: hypothetical protein EA378_09595 [Phycisphaerales bacterium]
MPRLKRRESGLIVVTALVCVGGLLLTRPGLVSRSRPAPPTEQARSSPSSQPAPGQTRSPDDASSLPEPPGDSGLGSLRDDREAPDTPGGASGSGASARDGFARTPRGERDAARAPRGPGIPSAGRVVTATTVEELVAKIGEGGVSEARLEQIRDDADAFFGRGERAEVVAITRIDEALRTLAWTDIAFDPETGRIAITLDPAAPLTALSITADAIQIGPDGRPIRVYMHVD